MSDGKVYSRRVDFALGDPRNPMNFEDVAVKFRTCAAEATKPLAKDNIEKVIKMLSNLEAVNNAGQIISLIS